MSESAAANLAGGGAIAALPTINTKSATDGAQIHTDGEDALSAFAMIFEKLAAETGTEVVGELEDCEALKLPEAMVVASEAVEELPELPALPRQIDPLQIDEELPVGEIPVQMPSVQVESVDADFALEPEVEEEPAEVEIQREEIRREQLDNDPEPTIPPMPAQIFTAEAPLEVEEPSRVASAPMEKRRPVPVERMDGQVKEIQRKNVEHEPKQAQVEVAEVAEQVVEEMPAQVIEEKGPERARPQPRKLEFALPQPQVVTKEVATAQVVPSQPVLAAQAFVEANHPKIVTEIRGRLLPDGGSMHIRLDPPELGALAVQIDVKDGILTASFQTSNDEATRLLSHSLVQLRHTLETQGVSVEKLQVQQTPREQLSSNSNSHDRERGAGQQAYERSAQDDQQRREMLQRMWRRLAVGRDMLDLVA